MPPTWKRLYFVHRSPALPPEAFVARWQQHSRLGGRFPDLLRRHVRVRYCLTLAATELSTPLARLHDGIGMLWLGSPQELDRPNEDPDVTPTMRKDELEVFEKPAFTWAMVVREETIVDGPLQPFVFLARFQRQDPGADAPFLAACKELAREPAMAPVGRITAGTLVRPSTMESDATLELWFASREAAVACVGRPDFQALVERTFGSVVRSQGRAAYLTQVCHERLAAAA